ncbi:hypothetical protein ACJRO7_018409 [Eucalyptus globulus]|uniref:C2 domain-containing protein n=1 Tax=Eucalyptus globulus TaxID=34317 RepID=A0ABD3KTN4_EUCGL
MTSDRTRAGPVSVEITVISAQGLRNPTLNALFSRRLKPYATLAVAAAAAAAAAASAPRPAHATGVDRRGGTNPTWNEKFRLPVDPGFFADLRSSVYLDVRARQLVGGEAVLGWCLIPAGDILSPEAAAAAGSVVFLSYRLRDRDGTRGHGTVNVSVRVVVEQGRAGCGDAWAGCGDAWRTVIGLPVASLRG